MAILKAFPDMEL